MAAMITIGAPMTAVTRLEAIVTMGMCMAIDITGNGNLVTGDLKMTGDAIPAVTVDGDIKRTHPRHGPTNRGIGLG